MEEFKPVKFDSNQIRFWMLLGALFPEIESSCRSRFNQRVGISIMTIEHLMTLAEEHYAVARVTANPAPRRVLTEIGNTYTYEAEELKRGRVVRCRAWFMQARKTNQH